MPRFGASIPASPWNCANSRASVGTLVERKTRFLVLCKMKGNGAEAVLDSFARQMKRLNEKIASDDGGGFRS